MVKKYDLENEGADHHGQPLLLCATKLGWSSAGNGDQESLIIAAGENAQLV